MPVSCQVPRSFVTLLHSWVLSKGGGHVADNGGEDLSEYAWSARLTYIGIDMSMCFVL